MLAEELGMEGGVGAGEGGGGTGGDWGGGGVQTTGKGGVLADIPHPRTWKFFHTQTKWAIRAMKQAGQIKEADADSVYTDHLTQLSLTGESGYGARTRSGVENLPLMTEAQRRNAGRPVPWNDKEMAAQYAKVCCDGANSPHATAA